MPNRSLGIRKHKWSSGFCIPWTTGMCRYWDSRRWGPGIVCSPPPPSCWASKPGPCTYQVRSLSLGYILSLGTTLRYNYSSDSLFSWAVVSTSPKDGPYPQFLLTCSVIWVNPGQCQKPRISRFALAWTLAAFQSYCHVWDTWVILIILEANYVNIHGEREPL